MQNKTALLLIGSPKPAKSSSENLGKLLIKNLSEQGVQTTIENIGVAFRKGTIQELIQKVNQTDITIISTPLYVDSLPSTLINFLELYRNDEKENDKKLIAIVNSGFPESFQNDSAIEVLRLFSIHNGFRWVGGFAIGCGGAFGNVDLENYKMAKNIAESFKNTAILLSRNESVPDEIIGNASKSIMPASLYLAFGQLGWYFQAIKYRTLFKLWDKPYVR